MLGTLSHRRGLAQDLVTLFHGASVPTAEGQQLLDAVMAHASVSPALNPGNDARIALRNFAAHQHPSNPLRGHAERVLANADRQANAINAFDHEGEDFGFIALDQSGEVRQNGEKIESQSQGRGRKLKTTNDHDADDGVIPKSKAFTKNQKQRIAVGLVGGAVGASVLALAIGHHMNSKGQDVVG